MSVNRTKVFKVTYAINWFATYFKPSNAFLLSESTNGRFASRDDEDHLKSLAAAQHVTGSAVYDNEGRRHFKITPQQHSRKLYKFAFATGRSLDRYIAAMNRCLAQKCEQANCTFVACNGDNV